MGVSPSGGDLGATISVNALPAGQHSADRPVNAAAAHSVFPRRCDTMANEEAYRTRTMSNEGQKTITRDKTVTRDKIMRAAIRQFAERGFDAVSVQSIVEEAQVSHGTIFWHFGNKEKLYTEVARWAGNQFYDAMRPEVECEGPPPSVTELARKQYAYLKSRPEIGRLSLSIVFESIGPHPELAPAMGLFNRRLTDIWRQWALRCSEVGLLRDDFNPEMVGTLVANTLASINVSSKVHRWENADDYFEAVAKIFESGCFIGVKSEAARHPALRAVSPAKTAKPQLHSISGGAGKLTG
jgi:AcrR family transcriptional regulator